MIKLDLGCGNNTHSDCIGIDIKPLTDVDIVADLNLGIPLKSNSIDCVYARHSIEHLDDPVEALREIHRVLKRDGTAEIILPHWSNYCSYTIWHKSLWHILDFDLYDPHNPYHYYTEISFKTLLREFNYGKLVRPYLQPIKWLINKILNFNHLFTEQFLAPILSPEEFKIILKKV